MSKQTFFPESIRYQYLLDKWEVRISTKPFEVSGPPRLKMCNRKQFKLDSGGVVISESYNRYYATKVLFFNMNDDCRVILKREIENPIALSKCEFEHGKNFVPCGYRMWLKHQGRTIAAVRHDAFDSCYNAIWDAISMMQQELSDVFGQSIDEGLFQATLNHCEVAFDMQAPQGIQFAQQEEFRNAIKRGALDTCYGYFDKQGNYQIRTSSMDVAAFDERDMIKAHINTDMGIIEMAAYQKEDGPFGSLNRIEGRLTTEVLKRVLGDRSVLVLGDLREKVSTVSDFVFGVVSSITKGSELECKSDWALLKRCLKSYLGKGWEELYECLKNDERISTKSTSNNIPRTLRRKIPALAKHDIIFKKIHSSTYKVDWANLPTAHVKFQNMKLKHIHKQKCIVSDKTPKNVYARSWANINPPNPPGSRHNNRRLLKIIN